MFTPTNKLIDGVVQIPQASSNNSEQELVPAEYWFNSGIEVTLPNGTEVFVPFVTGTALDQQMEKLQKLNEKSPAKPGSLTETIRTLMAVLIQASLEMAKEIPVGESRKVTGFPNGIKFVNEIRHAGKKDQSTQTKPTLSVADLLKAVS